MTVGERERSADDGITGLAAADIDGILMGLGESAAAALAVKAEMVRATIVSIEKDFIW